jgi:minor extracellular serine protease Vpr
LGYHEGPHDGTSLFDQYCDSLVGKGKIIVGAAGNEGGDSLHLDYSFSTTDSVVSSAIDFWGWPDGETFIDMWGEKGNDFSIEIALMNYYNHKKEDSTIKILYKFE